ncbi:alpha/beta hydrolase [Paractinoplanes ferrugineus]|uniref:Alpha/beta hydrolase n=1 Tax=Paractinoplanes ferrugineus TaxID=113564 RepID=A0A919JB01_9ACTN|nr:alpha/beta hydrolase [Actinoplanes ferrugineus]GIE16333.1 alpha/beta hydrolase [Actinoplanes ferrugineus]
MTLVRVNGVTLHVAELPPVAGDDMEPPTVVLVHGMAGDNLASWYLTMAHPLAASGLRVLMYDLRGHGRSDRPARGYALDDFADDLEGLLDHWGVTGRVHLVGNSFGGTVAFAYALRHPDRVAGVVAIDSAPPMPEWFARMSARLTRAGADPGRVGAGAAFARRLRDVRRLLSETEIVAELPASRLPAPAEFAALTCPVLCLYGRDSRVRELAGRTEQLLPQARSVVLDGAGHSVLIERTAEVRGHLLTWLRDTAPFVTTGSEGERHG